MKQTALVTGASGGIGQSISEVLAKNGYDVLLHYHSNKEAAHRLAERLSASFGVKVSVIQADLSSPDGAETLSRSVKQPVDALILNSGKSHFGLITDVTDDTAREMVQLHVTSPFLLARNLMPGMIRKKRGHRRDRFRLGRNRRIVRGIIQHGQGSAAFVRQSACQRACSERRPRECGLAGCR